MNIVQGKLYRFRDGARLTCPWFPVADFKTKIQQWVALREADHGKLLGPADGSDFSEAGDSDSFDFSAPGLEQEADSLDPIYVQVVTKFVDGLVKRGRLSPNMADATIELASLVPPKGQDFFNRVIAQMAVWDGDFRAENKLGDEIANRSR